MKTMGLRGIGWVGVAGTALLCATAGAQCLSGAQWRGGASNGPVPNSHRAVSGARLISAAYGLDDNDDQDGRRVSIVGMWHVHLVAQSVVNLPTFLVGAEVDAGYQQWHSDKTELLNSGRPPANGSFCTGVWEQTGPRTYQLNHFAISWTQGPAADANSGPTNMRTGPSSIVETVTVSPDGKTFSGTFTITDYAETDSPSGSSVSFADSITGAISGSRIDINTPIAPIF